MAINYWLHLPEGYQPPNTSGEFQRWPVILFLHGMGERGDSLQTLGRLLVYGIPKQAQEDPTFPFIAVSPQCPSDMFWPQMINELDLLLDSVLKMYACDPDRVYLTGLSMGGYGSWHMALTYPDRFAAMAPVCGGFYPGVYEAPINICSLRGLPIWAFHGALDTVVPPEQTLALVDALKDCGGDVRLTIYSDVGHDSWVPAYSDPTLYEWFLSNRRDNRPG